MTSIAKPTRSVFETSPEKLRPFLEGLAARVSGAANWMVRKKTICDLLLGLDAFFALPAAERRSLLAGEDAAEPDSDDGPSDFRNVLPLYVGAILEGFELELRRALENIADLNTPATKTRAPSNTSSPERAAVTC